MPKPTQHTEYKQTPIGLLPKHWEVEAVCNVFEFLPTNSFSRENLTYNLTKSKIHNIHYGDIHSKFNSEILDCESEILPFIKDELINTQNFNFIQDGDLVIADASEDYEGVGECVEIKNVGSKKIVSGLHTFLARDNSDKTAIGFRTYIFRNQKVNIELKKIATGISVFSISKTSLNKLKIPIPPLPEQQRIATILSTWDKAIDNVKSIIEQLQMRNKGLAQALFNDELRIKNYEWKTLNDVFIESKIEGNSSSSADKRITVRLSLKGIEKRDFKGTEVEDATYFFKRKAGQFIYGKQNLHKGAFGIIPKELDGFESSSDIPAFDFKENVHPKYIFYYFSRPSFYEKLEDISTGTGSKRIQPRELFKVKIKLPSFSEQKAITNILNTATTELTHYQQKLQQLQIQKKGLMQQLLTGKVLTVKQ